MHLYRKPFFALNLMVLLIVKKSENEQFLCSQSVKTLVVDALRTSVELRNLYFRLQILCDEVEKAVKSDIAGIVSRPLLRWAVCKIAPALAFLADVLGCLNTLSEDAHYAGSQAGLRHAITCGRDLLSKENISAKRCLPVKVVRQAICNFEVAIGADNTAGRLCEEKLQQLACTFTQFNKRLDGEYESDKTAMWFAGKKLDGSKMLQHYLGTNEKTTIIVKLQTAGDIKPSREPVISDAAQKEVMAWQFAKQQGQIALEADETDCTTSTWADPSLLKQSLSGLSRVCIQ